VQKYLYSEHAQLENQNLSLGSKRTFAAKAS
jgi:hypothetical protein